MKCLNCGSPSEDLRDPQLGITLQACRSCGFTSLDVEKNRENLSPQLVEELSKLELTRPESHACPRCASTMQERIFDPDRLALKIDICPTCDFLHFDHLEIQLFKTKAVPLQKTF